MNPYLWALLICAVLFALGASFYVRLNRTLRRIEEDIVTRLQWGPPVRSFELREKHGSLSYIVLHDLEAKGKIERVSDPQKLLAVRGDRPDVLWKWKR